LQQSVSGVIALPFQPLESLSDRIQGLRLPSIVKSLLLGLALFAAQSALPAENADPPGRVGRISLAAENTRLRIGDNVAQGAAALNWPLTTGAILQTGSGARSEARIGSTAIRIDDNSELEFVEVSDERIRLRMHSGSLLLTLNNAEQATETALDTTYGRLRFEAPGIYRADVAGGTTAFSAYAGAAVIDDLGLPLRRGERILLLGGASRNYLLGQAAHDAFRQWSIVQEQALAGPPNRYVSPEMTGQEALDRNGTWHETQEYGAAWFPHAVPAGWAPYRMGRWAWITPWGWTWIDQAPWGFAPFHYGRWILMGGRWAWLPGTYMARPVYAPALVSWLGQPGWGASFSFGTTPAVGWFPLGPKERYHPHYRSSHRHVHNINASHVPQAGEMAGMSGSAGKHGRDAHRHRGEAVTPVPQSALNAGAPAGQPATAIRDKGTPFPGMIASTPPHRSVQPADNHRHGGKAVPEGQAVRAQVTLPHASAALPATNQPHKDTPRPPDSRHREAIPESAPSMARPAPARDLGFRGELHAGHPPRPTGGERAKDAAQHDTHRGKPHRPDQQTTSGRP
jgi:hypothetical protein